MFCYPSYSLHCKMKRDTKLTLSSWTWPLTTRWIGHAIYRHHVLLFKLYKCANFRSKGRCHNIIWQWTDSSILLFIAQYLWWCVLQQNKNVPDFLTMPTKILSMLTERKMCKTRQHRYYCWWLWKCCCPVLCFVCVWNLVEDS